MSKLPRKFPDGAHEAFTTLAQLYATVEAELITAMNLFEQHGNIRSETGTENWKREVSQWLRRMRTLGNHYSFVAHRPHLSVTISKPKQPKTERRKRGA